MNGRLQAKWLYVGSSAVRALRYNPSLAELDVRFEEGREYRYRHVPRSKFRALLEAESIGTFVNHEIKPHHPCQEITSSSRRRPARDERSLRNLD